MDQITQTLLQKTKNFGKLSRRYFPKQICTQIYYQVCL